MNINLLERRQVTDITDKNILHIGSGRNGDFIIYKNSQPGKEFITILKKKSLNKIFLQAEFDNEPAQFTSQFKVFIIDKKTQELNQENRILRFWFYNQTQNQSLNDAHELIRTLFKSDEFPRGKFNQINSTKSLFFSSSSSRLFFFY